MIYIKVILFQLTSLLAGQQIQSKGRQMSNADTGLLGFLKKKSLFQQSPTKNAVKKRSRSKSRDGKDSIIRKINERDFEEQNNRVNQFTHTASDRQLRGDGQERNGRTQEPLFSFMPESEKHMKRTASRLIEEEPKRTYDRNPEQKQILPTKSNEKTAGNNFWTGMVSYASSFQSARVESAQCLQTLSIKMGTEISNINYRLDQFNNNIKQTLTNELQVLKQRITAMVEEAFKESEKNIREFMKQEEKRLASEILKTRELLQKEYVLIEGMKEDINSPSWRKVAGEILSTDLQKRIADLVKKANQTDIPPWQSKDLSGQRLKVLQSQLKNLVRFKE